MLNVDMEIAYKELQRYGEIIADKNHETTEGHCIRFTTYLFEDVYYVAIMFDGYIVAVVEKDDIRKMLKPKECGNP